MPYEPGTLLVVTENIKKCKVDYFKTWISNEQSPNCKLFETWPYVGRVQFQPGDNIFIIDYFGVDRGYSADHIWHGWKDWFYRIWVNGEEVKRFDHHVLEITEYYEVVK